MRTGKESYETGRITVRWLAMEAAEDVKLQQQLLK